MLQGCSPFQPNLLPRARILVILSYKYLQRRSVGKVSQRKTGTSLKGFSDWLQVNFAFQLQHPIVSTCCSSSAIPNSQDFAPINCLTHATRNTKAHFLLQKTKELNSSPNDYHTRSRRYCQWCQQCKEGLRAGPTVTTVLWFLTETYF